MILASWVKSSYTLPAMKEIHALKMGDTIGIAAPSSPFDRAKFMKGVRVLEKLGFKVHYRRDIFDQSRYLAGTDARRAEEFTELLKSRDISAVMFARGGYGSQRVIPLLSADVLKEHPKPVIGFSDITPLLAFLRQNCGIPTFYGPVVIQLGGAKGATTADALLRAITTKGPIGTLPAKDARVLKAGSAEGPLVGGCLALINSSMGTPYELSANGAILFIEERNEKVYVLDRMLTQLKNSGVLSAARGIVFGSIIPPADEPHDVEAMIRDVLSDYQGPVVMNFPAGHTDEFITLPMGVEAELKANLREAPILNFKTGLLI